MSSSPPAAASNSVVLVTMVVGAACGLAQSSYFAPLAGGRVDWCSMGVVLSGVTVSYVLDRLQVHEEDEGSGYSQYLVAQRVGGPSVAVALAVLAACLWSRPNLLWVGLELGFLSIWYGVPLPVIGKRVKALCFGSKTVYAGFMHMYATMRMTEADMAGHPWICFCFFLNAALVTVFMDVKDAAGDKRAGIPTLPNTIGCDDALRVVAGAYVLSAFANGVGIFGTRCQPVALAHATMAVLVERHARKHLVPEAGLGYLAFSLPWLSSWVV